LDLLKGETSAISWRLVDLKFNNNWFM